MASRRASDPGSYSSNQYASSYMSNSLYRIARRSLSEEAQRKLDERKNKPKEPSSKLKAGSNSRYSQETIDEALLMIETGWSIPSVSKVLGIPYHTLVNWKAGYTRAPSAATGKKAKY